MLTLRRGGQVEAERADPGARVEDQVLAAVEGELHAGRVAAVAVHLRPRGGDRASRAPDLDLHRRASSPRVRVQRPEEDHRPGGSLLGGDDREGAGLDLVLRSARRTDPEHAVGRPALAHRLGRWQVVQRDRLAIVVEGPVGGDPFLGAHAPRVLERAPEQGARGLVVEDQRAVLVEQEGGRRDARQQVAGQDQLQGLLGASRHHAHSSTPRSQAGVFLPQYRNEGLTAEADVRPDQSGMDSLVAVPAPSASG